MLELKGNIWDYHNPYPIVITTNGWISENKYAPAVMGRGLALEAKKKFPELPKMLAKHLRQFGNIVKYFDQFNLFTFPTKINWWENSNIDLIMESAGKLVNIVPLYDFGKVYIPRPGCGNGHLEWDNIKPILEQYFDDRFIVVNKYLQCG